MAETNGKEIFPFQQPEPWKDLEQRLEANGFCKVNINYASGNSVTNYQNPETGILYFIRINDHSAQIISEIHKIPSPQADMSAEDIRGTAFPVCSPKATPHLSGVRTGANPLAY